MRVRCVALLMLAWLFTASAGTAMATEENRFGPPWMAVVTAEQGTTVYAAGEQGSPVVGPLSKDAILIVTGPERNGLRQILDGWVPAGDIVERTEPYVAEVTRASVSLYAKPNESSEIRRTAAEGDLVRVTGVSPGLDGDIHTWWATTEGYAQLGTLRGATNEWAQEWSLPPADLAVKGWWGQVSPANVRAAPTTEAPIVGELAGGERVKVLEERQGQPVSGDDTWYRVDGGRFAGGFIHGSRLNRIGDPTPNLKRPERGGESGTWIVVDRPAKTLTLVRDNQPQFTTYVALGRAGVDTPPGDYTIFGKYRADDMTSSSVPDATRPYDLPNVPAVQYFKDGGFAIHGTYWHDFFGTDQSEGCVNLTWTDAAYLFGLTMPGVPEGAQVAWTGNERGGTPLLIVD